MKRTNSKTAAAATANEELLNLDTNYSDTLGSVQNRLSPGSRTFSKIIHAPAVERSSELMERTIMRPSVVMGTTWTAFIVGLVFYLTARYYGFTLSGGEMLLALLGGAMLGLTLEGIWYFIRQHDNS
jgi:hypothetical protein